MTVRDFVLLTKKVAVGIAVTTVPAIILLGGLWATEHSLHSHRNIFGSVADKKGRQ